MGLAGGLAAWMLALSAAPEITSLAEYAALRHSLALVSKWLLMPSMVVALCSGLLAMAVHYPYINAPWVWAKAVTGVALFEAMLGGIDAPAQRAAKASARAAAGEIDAATLAGLVSNEWGAWWAILAICVANVVLAIWRPRFGMKAE